MTDWPRRFAAYYEDILRAQALTSSRSLTDLSKLFDRQVACDLGVLGVELDDVMAGDLLVVDLRGVAEAEVESDVEEEAEGEGEEEGDGLGGAVPPPSDPRAREARAARKIHRSQMQDPYNRETTLGGPIVRFRRGGSQVSGPLLYWDVELSHDPGRRRLTVSKRTVVPELNTMILEPFLAPEQGIGEVVEKVREVLHSELSGDALISGVLGVISGAIDDLEAVSLDAAVDQPLRLWVRDRTDDLAICRRAVLVNVPRSNAVLFDDLRRIQEMDEIPAGGPLDLITRLEDSDRDPPPEDLRFSFSESLAGSDPLLFPFESNPAQRRVAQMAERARILTVQGPPGTGKSHTLANLVCHLAATGRSVLVTSHQRKAVEVVGDLLRPMRGLVLSLARGDRKASQELKAGIQSVLEDATLRVESLEAEVRNGMDAVHGLERELRTLAHRFQELSRKEHQNWHEFKRYWDLRDWDFIDPEDTPGSEERERIVSALPEWCHLRLMIESRVDELRTLLCPGGVETPGSVEARVAKLIQELVRLGHELREHPVRKEVLEVRVFLESELGDAWRTASQVENLLAWLSKEGRQLLEAGMQGGWGANQGLDLARWQGAARSAPEGEHVRLGRRLAEMASWFEAEDHFWDGVPRFGTAVEAEEAREVVDALTRASRSLLTWMLSPTARRARRVASERFRRAPSRAAVERWAVGIRWAILRFEQEARVVDLAAEVDALLPEGLNGPKAEVGKAERPEWVSVLRRLRASCCLLALSREAPVRLWEELARIVHGQYGIPFGEDSVAEVERVLRGVANLITRDRLLKEFQDGVQLTEQWHEALQPLVAGLRSGRLDEAARSALDRLVPLQEVSPAFRRMRDLERGELASLTATRARLEAELVETGRTPEWVVSRIDEALEAHRLSRLIRGSLAADPDDVASVAESLRKGQRKRLELIGLVVERKLRLQQARKRGEGSAELLLIQQLLAGSGRMQRSLVSLRDRINYPSVLSIFPAWLATIDDACRFFPAKQALFDYIIVDEASQCAQPALLPLALRCRHLIVVGDRKQLRPTFGRFLSRTTLEAFAAKHGLAEHRAGVFVEGGRSLLDFAEFRANQQAFLDEHFRCDPAIIHWSNQRYYGGRLNILTHRRPLTFRPALEVRRLDDADDIPDRKVNPEEAKAVIRELRRLTQNPDYQQLTIGVLSPFRQQADLLQGMIEREFEREPEVIERHRLIASTADGFQGDERDIILYSFRVGPSTPMGSLGVLEREEERFNVAFSRARRFAISFLSVPLDRLPSSGVTRSWIEHATKVNSGNLHGGAQERPDHFDSEFERSVCMRLRDRGLQVTTQEPCGQYRIDLVVRDAEGRTLAVECDGAWKEDVFGVLRQEDYQRQDLIERAGWVVHRVSGRKYLLDPVREIERLLEVLSNQPTDRDQAVLAGYLEPSSPGRSDRSTPREGPQELGPGEAADGMLQRPRDDDGGVLDKHLGQTPEPAASGQVVLGRPVSEIRPILIELVRWSLLGSRVEGAMFDRLVAIDDRLRKGEMLLDADITALEFIYRIARQEGFDPEMR